MVPATDKELLSLTFRRSRLVSWPRVVALLRTHTWTAAVLLLVTAVAAACTSGNEQDDEEREGTDCRRHRARPLAMHREWL
jgi:hypothetical protein